MPVRLLFQDEARFGRISDQRRCWAPLPLRPIIGHQIVRQFVYGLAAVSPLDGELCSLVLPWVDTEAMSLFLAHTAARFPHQYCLLLLDGAGWHRALALRVPPNMQLLPLPPYSPELNPVEHLSGIISGRTTWATGSFTPWSRWSSRYAEASRPYTNSPNWSNQ